MLNLNYKVFDSVYGYIHLTPVEREIYKTPTLQRLNNIKQMGMTNLLFPSASHTRLSHSLGVLYIVDKMISQLLKRMGKKAAMILNDGIIQDIRLAALLHDCCHFPYSHVGERAYNTLLKAGVEQIPGKEIDKMKSPIDGLTYPSSSPDKFHEGLSAELILRDKYINRAFRRHNLNAPEGMKVHKHIMAQLITGHYTDNPLFGQLVKFELDADRLDYLVRDSFFTGSHFGAIELDTLLSKMKLYTNPDSKIHEIVLDDDGGIIADHFILSRFFWNSAILKRPKMRLLDELIIIIMLYLVKIGRLPDPATLITYIKRCSQRFKDQHGRHKIYCFTDEKVNQEMLALHDRFESRLKDGKKLRPKEIFINDCIKTVTDGTIPGAIYETRRIAEVQYDSRNKVLSSVFDSRFKERLKKVKRDIATELKIPEDRIIFYYSSENLSSITKYELAIAKKGEKGIRIFNEFRPRGSEVKLLQETNSSVLSVLSNKVLNFFYAYYLPTKSGQNNPKYETLRKVFVDKIRVYGIESALNA